jgi:hypothetical protein
MKKLLFTGILLATTSFYAQVGIGTTTPAPSSVLDLTSTTTGFLPPRLTTAQRDLITPPAEGLTIYNSNTKRPEIFNGTDWISVFDGSVVTTPPPPTITALYCDSATFTPGTITAMLSYTGEAIVPYTDGNGIAYSTGSPIDSTGVTGLSATLQAGTLATGDSTLTYTISGIANSDGTASFAIIFGGQICTLDATISIEN